MLIFLRILFSIIAVAIAGYGIMSNNFDFQPFMILALGLSMLVMGLQEFKQNKKRQGWLMMIIFAFSLFVSIRGFMMF
ncbi:DUF3953 domain-containing protein [Paenibacillus sp. UMB7766-LJ446]|uniref:DUF3953 domain-containing protein n=1 Tax=Paenibacillus sp. UMB7766-LJ446 TaxID=3046313 RepID=UPI0025509074|nr:DUF3953 domain-containing protein [Paenibacillus sp. UMB7766-LJ446]MDK8192586.1 DUF3953 domain-containing protein [Paenibacillus sp. UMB7766-LJ446]